MHGVERVGLAWVFHNTRAFFLAIGGTQMGPKTGKLKVRLCAEANGIGSLGLHRRRLHKRGGQEIDEVFS